MSADDDKIEIDFDEAKNIAKRHISSLESAPGELMLVDSGTIEKYYGWIFFYNSKAYLVDGDEFEALGGNSPFLVERYGGNVKIFGTAYSIKKYLADYERLIKPRS
jgi:Immunity protein 35